MPFFHYEGYIGDNEFVEGSIEAPDEPAARARLSARRCTPLVVTQEAAPAVVPLGAEADYRSLTHNPVTREAPFAGAEPRRMAVVVARRSLAQFYRQMASIVHSGMSVTEGLRHVRAHTSDRRMRRALEALEATVAAGRPMSDAMARHPDVFSPGQVGFVRASERGGFLDAAFSELAAQAEADWGAEAAARYNPMLVLVRFVLFPFIAGWIIFMGGLPTFTMPGGIEASLLRGLVAAGLTAGILASSGPVLRRLHRQTAPGRLVESILMQMPVVGARFRRADRVRAVASLSHALAAGVPLSIAWDLAAEAPDSDRYHRRLTEQAWRIRSGQPVSEAMAATGLFDTETLNAVRSGEQTGDLPEMLERAIRYDREEAALIANLTPWVVAMIAYFLYLLAAGSLVLLMGQLVYG